MSVPIDLAALAERIDEFGPIAYLVSIGDEGRPHVVSVRVAWEDDDLVVGAGRRTLANVERSPHVTMLWPASRGMAYSLIVDGNARPRTEAEEPALGIVPTAAVLHRTADGDPSAPSCIQVTPSP